MIRQGVLLLCLPFAGTALAAAQPDPAAEPTQGSAFLSAGFTPDPFLAEIEAGGDLPADTLGERCAGYIAQAPDFGLYYNSGNFPLIVSAASRNDTTLAIRSPDGQWRCDDDSGEGPNPSVRFDGPQSGYYGIWIGTRPRPGRTQARLAISELYSH